MGIGNIHYAMPNIPAVDIARLQRRQEETAPVTQVQQSQSASAQSPSPVGEAESGTRQLAPIDPQTVSLTFNKQEDFNLLGSESDIESLDMQKAISDMRKDSILQQYQYFVGSSDNLLADNQSEDGAVFLKF